MHALAGIQIEPDARVFARCVRCPNATVSIRSIPLHLVPKILGKTEADAGPLIREKRRRSDQHATRATRVASCDDRKSILVQHCLPFRSWAADRPKRFVGLPVLLRSAPLAVDRGGQFSPSIGNAWTPPGSLTQEASAGNSTSKSNSGLGRVMPSAPRRGRTQHMAPLDHFRLRMQRPDPRGVPRYSPLGARNDGRTGRPHLL